MLQISRECAHRAVLAISLSLAAAAALGQAAPSGYAALDQYQVPAAKQADRVKFAAPSGASLHETLNRWAAQAGWKPVVWQLPEDTDFTLGAARRFDGDIGQAAKTLVQALGAEADLRVQVDTAAHVLTVAPAQ